MIFLRFAFALLLCLAAALPAQAGPKRNVVIFVADGLRYASVTPETAPTMTKVRLRGVDFVNSHAAYPTLTMANASVIATGHYLGDTGVYANTLYFGFPVPCHLGSNITFIEDDCILRDLKEHFPADYIGQTTLIQAARAAGYNTVIIGKRGPAAHQDMSALDSKDDSVEGPLGIFIDEATNHPTNPDGTPTKSTTLNGKIAGDILKATGSAAPPFTSTPNLTQQAYYLSATTQVLIPDLKESGKPFVLLFWSRDPDFTQHNADESENHLLPGINSYAGRAAIANADNDLKGILDALDQYGLKNNTDVFVTADHGFSTIAKGIPTPQGTLERNSLAGGFVAIDVAGWLGNQKVFDPDRSNAELDLSSGDHPLFGDALIGPSPETPMAIVTANGGSDFIYVPDGADAHATAKRIFDNLLKAPYVGALFVNDGLLKNGNPKDFAGALPMSAVNLLGSSKIPQPAIVVGFRSFVMKGCKLGPEMCAAEISDSGLHTGQGMHGSGSRADSRNFMAAIGPDFKIKFKSTAPAGNVDIAPTLAHIMGVKLTGPGSLKGRVIVEALRGGKMPKVIRRTIASPPAANGVRTVLNLQAVGSTRYFDAAGIPGRTVGLSAK